MALFGKENTVFPPALKGHNWNTIDMLTETSPLQKGTVPHFYWVIKAVDSSLRNCVMTRSRFEDARTFRQLSHAHEAVHRRESEVAFDIAMVDVQMRFHLK